MSTKTLGQATTELGFCLAVPKHNHYKIKYARQSSRSSNHLPIFQDKLGTPKHTLMHRGWQESHLEQGRGINSHQILRNTEDFFEMHLLWSGNVSRV